MLRIWWRIECRPCSPVRFSTNSQFRNFSWPLWLFVIAFGLRNAAVRQILSEAWEIIPVIHLHPGFHSFFLNSTLLDLIFHVTLQIFGLEILLKSYLKIKTNEKKHFSNQHHWKSQYLTLSFILYSPLVQFFVVLFRDSLLLTLSPAAVRTCSVKAWISRMPNAKQRAKRKGTSWPSDLRIVHRALVIKDAEMFFLSWAFQQDPFTDLCCIRGFWLLSSIIICWKNNFVKMILTRCRVG